MIGRDREPPFEVPEDKIVQYLLNLDHPKGGPKARYFLAFGFNASQPLQLAEALLAQREAHGLTTRLTEVAGRKRLVCEGPVVAPDGRRPHVRTVWQLYEGVAWRLITAVPLGR